MLHEGYNTTELWEENPTVKHQTEIQIKELQDYLNCLSHYNEICHNVVMRMHLAEDTLMLYYSLSI